MANTEDALADIIYNKENLAHIIKLFPSFIVDKLAKVPGYKEEKYQLFPLFFYCPFALLVFGTMNEGNSFRICASFSLL